MYCWCVLYYKLLFLVRVSDSVSFSVYVNIFKRYILHFLKMPRSVNTFRTKSIFPKNVYIYIYIYIQVFSAGNITGIFGGKYYCYFRR